MIRRSVVAALIFAASTARAGITVSNSSFEEGLKTPAGWTLEGRGGAWLRGDAATGRRAVAVSGTGVTESAWLSAPVSIEPSKLYEVRFRARRVAGGGGGTPVTGPAFCNRDVAIASTVWTGYESVFATPPAMTPADRRLHFGQWRMNGAVAYDDIRVVPAEPVYVRSGAFVLGEGESLSGTRYAFTAPFDTPGRNSSRPLAGWRARFNTNRWVLGAGDEVVYRHAVGDRLQTGAVADVAVTYYEGGELAVEASRDGATWQELGVIAGKSRHAFPVPASLLPAAEIWIRLRVRTGAERGPGADPGSLQVGAYGYRSVLAGPPVTLTGRTAFVAVTGTDPRLSVSFDSLGDQVPNGNDVIKCTVTNLTAKPLAVRAEARTVRDGRAQPEATFGNTLQPGPNVRTYPYPVPGPGDYTITLKYGPGYTYEAETRFRVPDLYEERFGELLPDSMPGVGLWWASAGWKVNETRGLPGGQGGAVRISAARNETEAAQIVIRPELAVTNLRVEAGPLRRAPGADGPGMIPAANVEILRVAYVPVEEPTDARGFRGRWPDPLPPFTAPVNLEAGRNYPVWVRVRVPKDVVPGVFTGTIRFSSDAWHASATLLVEVYDFALPDRMTLTTAFGFDARTVFRYQKLEREADRRSVLDRYYADFAAHHVSPYAYGTAPLDPIRTEWPGAGAWTGGRRDQEVKFAGRSSLLVEDDSPTSQPSATYRTSLPIPKKGLRLAFQYRTKTPGQAFLVSLSHDDASGEWMPGRNLDISLTGTGEWQSFDRTITAFPAGAKSVRLALYASLWQDDGSPQGAVWYDQLSFRDAGNGKELAPGGDFEPLEPAALAPVIDWSAWDREMGRQFAAYHWNSFSFDVPGLGGGSFQSRTEPSLLGYSEGTTEYQTAMRNWCAAAEAHLREKGWLKDAFVYWFDEPEPRDYAFVSNGFRKLREYMPGIRRMLTEQPEPALLGGPNVWCPVLDAYDRPAMHARQTLGETLWWYICTGPKEPYVGEFIDRGSPDLRIWCWQTWQENVSGILIWATDYWTSPLAYPDGNAPQNPYVDAMSWTNGAGSPGTRDPWGNGDGRFLYPPEAAADGHPAGPVLAGPVDSIRWEHLRDGIEDYEYLAILKRLIDAKGFQPGLRKGYDAYLEVPAALSRNLTSYAHDPTPLERRRDEVARMIEQLGKLP
ncbi:MAG: glycoside hydrolase domain-containing protein [Candidatus Coatesbacteria bacterium]